MISEEFIKALAVKLQTDEINIAREYVQNLFLNYFYQKKNTEFILFKGGTALRLLHRSPRFSEDLDFSTSKVIQKEIEVILEDTFLDLDREKIGVDILESTPTTGGFLNIFNAQVASYRADINIEISSRKKVGKGEILAVDNPYIPSYIVHSLPTRELVSEKVEALMNRRKARDYFDLYFMLRANLLPEKSVLKKIFILVNETKIDFKDELEEFLPRSHHRIIKDFKKILKNEIEKYM